jgi:hypothetical protein
VNYETEVLDWWDGKPPMLQRTGGKIKKESTANLFLRFFNINGRS